MKFIKKDYQKFSATLHTVSKNCSLFLPTKFNSLQVQIPDRNVAVKIFLEVKFNLKKNNNNKIKTNNVLTICIGYFYFLFEVYKQVKPNSIYMIFFHETEMCT